ncbi:MAG: aldo/keto reductase [Desulfobacterales bacterium]
MPGKVKFIGLSNVTADQIVAAHNVHSIAVVQYEYSLWRQMGFYCCFTPIISISTRRFMRLPSRVLLEPINFWAP